MFSYLRNWVRDRAEEVDARLTGTDVTSNEDRIGQDLNIAQAVNGMRTEKTLRHLGQIPDYGLDSTAD